MAILLFNQGLSRGTRAQNTVLGGEAAFKVTIGKHLFFVRPNIGKYSSRKFTVEVTEASLWDKHTLTIFYGNFAPTIGMSNIGVAQHSESPQLFQGKVRNNVQPGQGYIALQLNDPDGNDVPDSKAVFYISQSSNED